MVSAVPGLLGSLLTWSESMSWLRGKAVASEVLWSDFLDLNSAPLLTSCDLEHPCFCLLTWKLRARVVGLLLCCWPLHLAHLTTGQQSTVSEKGNITPETRRRAISPAGGLGGVNEFKRAWHKKVLYLLFFLLCPTDMGVCVYSLPAIL